MKKPWLQRTLIAILSLLIVTRAQQEAFLAVAFLFVLLLFVARKKKCTKNVENNRVIDVLSRGGYVLKGQDAGGNLTFVRKDHVDTFDKN